MILANAIFAKLYRQLHAVVHLMQGLILSCGVLHTVAASPTAADLDAALRVIDTPSTISPYVLSPAMSLDALLAGMANKIYLAEKRSEIDNRIAYLQADQQRIRTQMLEQQELAEAEAKYQARERAEKERQRREPQTNWFAKAIAIGGMAAVISQAEGISSELAMEMMVQYSAGVLTDQNPVELSANLEQIAQKHIQFQATQIQQLQIARAQLQEQAEREYAIAKTNSQTGSSTPPRRIRDADVPPSPQTRLTANTVANSSNTAAPSSNSTTTAEQRISFAESNDVPPLPQADAQVAAGASAAPTPTMPTTQTEGASLGASTPPQSERIPKASDFCPEVKEHILPQDFAGPIVRAWPKFAPGDRTVGAVVWSEPGNCADQAHLIAEARAMLMNMDGQKRVWAPNPNGENGLRLRGNGSNKRLCPLPENFAQLALSRHINIQAATISCSFIGSEKFIGLGKQNKNAEDFQYWGICSAIYDVEPC